MKLKPIPVLALLVAIGAGFTGHFVVAIVALIVGLFSLFLGAVRHSDSPNNQGEHLGEDARWLLRPIKELRAGLEQLSKRESGNAAVSVIAAEALGEADLILERATLLVQQRQVLKRALKGRGEAETNLNRLQRQYTEAKSDSERNAIESALESRQKELSHYDTATAKIQEIESKLKEAEATLSELKSRLTAGAIGSNTSEFGQDDFTDMVQRLKTLGKSFEEANDTLEVRQ